MICTPFDKPGHFYFNQKINCLRASGKVTVGEREYMLDPSDSFAVLDWGRGVWTYHNTWYWASASGLVDGVPFGFNLGYGFPAGPPDPPSAGPPSGRAPAAWRPWWGSPGCPG